ncbi:MAG: pantetheine-phosphate adenylyltransferase [Eubacteriales bacterium]|nr:pantetheine-phosphate adenylyltransferase [Eubacteriales bacterium]
MTKAIFTGSFDPFTMGHLDILKRAASLFDSVTVGVLENGEKHTAFNAEERCALIARVIEEEAFQNVRVEAFTGLAVELAKRTGSDCMLRGLRDAGDLPYEQRMERLNLHLAPDIQTVYMAASPAYAHISSSAVKEICALGGKLEGLVPAPIQISIAERLIKR